MADERRSARSSSDPPEARAAALSGRSAPAAGSGEAAARAQLPRLSPRQAFASLRYPNYRLWFVGQLASLVGTWMQTTAQGFLVYDLTHSPAFLGYVGFAGGVPSLLFMLYGGVIADRLSRRVLLVVTQAAMMVLAFILGALAFLHVVQPWHIVVLAFLLGVANAFDAPARQSFVLEMVERENLSNAIALNSMMFNAATVVGPAVGGLVYAALGPAWCFTINGVSFIAVIAALLRMRLALQPPSAPSGSVTQALAAGIRYVATQPIVRTLVLVGAIGSLIGMGYATLIPAWAVTVLGGDSATNGWLLSARGLGSLVAALMIASLGHFQFKGKVLTVGTIAFPALLLVFSVVRWLPLALLSLVGVGWGFMVLFNMLNSLIQHLVPDDLRGRVMAVYSLGFMGLAPIGSLLVGGAATAFGAPVTVAVSAVLLLGVAAFLWLRMPELRSLE